MSSVPPPPDSHDFADIPPPAESRHEIPASAGILTRRKKLSWAAFGGDGFLVSVAFHVLLVIAGLFYVIQRYRAPEKKPETEVFATGAGGGAEGDRAKQFEHRMNARLKTPVKTPSRIVSKSPSSTVTLPSMPATSVATFDTGLAAGGLSKGSGGGSGGGAGKGAGIGTGDARHLVTLFGRRLGAEANVLEGTLFDLKKNAAGKARYDFGSQGDRVKSMREAFELLVRTGFRRESMDGRYFQAPNRLFTGSILIPGMPAEKATEAFECADVIKAPGWLAYYEGWITPPETDDYRFCGMGDDALAVAVDGKPALWAAWPAGGMPTWIKAQKDWEPAAAYKAGVTNPDGGGRYFGTWLHLEKGRRYRLVITFSECYGGLFASSVAIQQKKFNAEKSPGEDAPMFMFKLAPITAEELPLKRSNLHNLNPEGPSFGLEFNGLKSPPKSVR